MKGHTNFENKNVKTIYKMSEIKGTIKTIEETKSFGANGFRKREFVVTSDSQYPQHILIEATQDKCDLLNKFKAGDAVNVSYNINGREWVNPQGETKYFNSVQMWRIEAVSGGNQQQDRFEPTANYREEDHDSLPF